MMGREKYRHIDFNQIGHDVGWRLMLALLAAVGSPVALAAYLILARPR